MDFITYLKSKKIDPIKFKDELLDQYEEWLKIFDHLHPDSFTQQKLFLVNKLRRKYTLKEEEENKKLPSAKVMKPKIKPLKPKAT